MTPKYAWENIKQYIPNNKIIWEPFYGDGKSGDNLKELGFNVIHAKPELRTLPRAPECLRALWRWCTVQGHVAAWCGARERPRSGPWGRAIARRTAARVSREGS